MAKVGRPKIEFDIKHVQLLGRFRATYETMADWFQCSVDTIRRQMQDTDSEFCKAYKKASTHLKMAISEAQVKLALSGNCTMLIFLGKQYLGQADKVENVGEKGIDWENITFRAAEAADISTDTAPRTDSAKR